MIIRRGVYVERTGELFLFNIDADDELPIHHAKMQADEVRLALDNYLNQRAEFVEPWAEVQASHILGAPSTS